MAVATLELSARHGAAIAIPAVRSIREVGHPDPQRAGDVSGGTIGPLPDGTVIEVRPVEKFELGWAAGLLPVDHPQLWKTSDLVERFNAS